MRLNRWGITALPLLAWAGSGCDERESGKPSVAPMPISCELTTPGPAPLHLLTRFQYDNALRDLLGDTSRPSSGFPPENEVDGYRTNTAANAASPALVASYLSAAETAAARATADRLVEVAPCSEGEDPSACGRAFITRFSQLAFRRPLGEAELNPLLSLFDLGQAQGYAKGIEWVIQAVLQSPQFLYRVDGLRSPTVESGAVALGGYELAGRLAFSLWGSLPDGELLAAATEGRLITRADVEREARRLLADPRAADVVRDFSEQWLGLSRLEGAARVGNEAFGTAFVASLRTSLDSFVQANFFGSEGGFRSLFSSPQVWVDGLMAPVYGAVAPIGGQLEATILPEPRYGLLTQPAVMTLLAHAEQSAPVIRGVFVRERILCLPVLPPPPDLVVVPPDPDPTATTRRRFSQHTEQIACSGCHQLIDGIGFGFERYDQLGRYRALENALPVDESGSLLATEEPGLDGPFASSAELLERIANSTRARDCLAVNAYRYTFGRMEQPEDQCSLSQVKQHFAASGGDLQELLVALTLTDTFLYRPAIPEAP